MYGKIIQKDVSYNRYYGTVHICLQIVHEQRQCRKMIHILLKIGGKNCSKSDKISYNLIKQNTSGL